MALLEVKDLTKDYGYGRGVFDVSFHVDEGKVFGFLGPNGAGKTTTIRHIMGFSRPQAGSTSVDGMDSWEHAAVIQRGLGYLPGEIALPQGLTGTQFIEFMAELRSVTDMSKTEHLLDKFDLDPTGKLKRMALGVKRKLAIVTAFMHDPKILVLDEPTSGLDPIMQETFIDFVLEEKRLGKTILLSSHIFSEVEATCDRIAIIKDGRVVSEIVTDDLRHKQDKVYELEFSSQEDFERFTRDDRLERYRLGLISEHPNKRQVKVGVHDNDINGLFSLLSDYSLKFLKEEKFTLEEYFLDFYDRNKSVEEGIAHVAR
ncbi:MAG: ATP-binding cassette domain-containing protein [Thermoleophilia bacterium]|nr:ATP-binding cassette domain-containing protein [Thermoleophilia bacterium]